MSSTYRADIQGLRAVAVLLVVFYHSHLIFKGGFIGVDVFFVISGYVITKSLISEIDTTNHVSLTNFISRRIKRLLPASTVLALFTLFCSVFIFSPYSEQTQIAYTSLSSTFFSTNIYFILQNSYSALIDNPFRHMWSLGVEEQFYVFLIISVAVILQLSKSSVKLQQRIIIFTLLVAIFSFVLNVIFTSGIRLLPLPTRIAFFSPLTRMWELQIGVLAAFLPVQRIEKMVRSLIFEFFAVAGIVIIFWSALSFDSFAPFPGQLALLPTLGAVLVLLTSQKSQLVSSTLSLKPLRLIGDISYSWYLWHWPFIVFCQILAPGNALLLALSGFGSIIPAFLSYRFVEVRFRSKGNSDIYSAKKIASISIGLQLVAALLVLIGASTKYGLKTNESLGIKGSFAYESGCEMTANPFPAEKCLFVENISEPLVLLIGDSQAGAISDGFKAATHNLKLNFAVWYSPGCPVFPRATLEYVNCQPYLDALPGLIQKLQPDVIAIANKSTLYTTAGSQRGGLTIPRGDGSLPKTHSESITMWINGLTDQFTRAEYADKRLLLFQQIPPAKPMGPTLLNSDPSNSRFDLNSVQDRNKLISSEVDELSSYENITTLDPAEILCPNGMCFMNRDNKPVYSDQFHLSPDGAMMLKDDIRRAISDLIKRP
jgi:peptidoglycan/LPS O-acetylase OafA/YrhL